MTGIGGASNAKANRELTWNPGAPELAGGIPRDR